MNSINTTVFNLANELNSLLSNELYSEYFSLKFASKTLFQWAFENGILKMDKTIEDEYYFQSFTIVGFGQIFELCLIGLDYQEN